MPLVGSGVSRVGGGGCHLILSPETEACRAGKIIFQRGTLSCVLVCMRKLPPILPESLDPPPGASLWVPTAVDVHLFAQIPSNCRFCQEKLLHINNCFA